MSLTETQRRLYQSAIDFAGQQVAATIDRTPDYFPIYTSQGRWFHQGELWTDWTGGFFAGRCGSCIASRRQSAVGHAGRALFAAAWSIGSTTATSTTWALSFSIPIFPGTN